MMKILSVVCLFLLMSTSAATASVTTFPADGWERAKIEKDGRALVVKDAAGKLLLRFNTEGGDFADKLVVSQAVDRLVIDPRPAFAAGMGKLVFCSADFDPKPFLNADATLVNELGGTPGTRMLMYFEGHATGRHYYKSREIALKGHRKSYAMVQCVPEQLNSLHLRWDVMAPARGPIEFYGAKYAPTAELPVSFEKPVVRPELLFHAPFDGTADAKTARGAAQPKRVQSDCAAAVMSSTVRTHAPPQSFCSSSMLGVSRVVRGRRSFSYTAMASSSMRASPAVAIITGSTTSGPL